MPYISVNCHPQTVTPWKQCDSGNRRSPSANATNNIDYTMDVPTTRSTAEKLHARTPLIPLVPSWGDKRGCGPLLRALASRHLHLCHEFLHDAERVLSSRLLWWRHNPYSTNLLNPCDCTTRVPPIASSYYQCHGDNFGEAAETDADEVLFQQVRRCLHDQGYTIYKKTPSCRRVSAPHTSLCTRTLSNGSAECGASHVDTAAWTSVASALPASPVRAQKLLFPCERRALDAPRRLRLDGCNDHDAATGSGLRASPLLDRGGRLLCGEWGGEVGTITRLSGVTVETTSALPSSRRMPSGTPCRHFRFPTGTLGEGTRCTHPPCTTSSAHDNQDLLTPDATPQPMTTPKNDRHSPLHVLPAIRCARPVSPSTGAYTPPALTVEGSTAVDLLKMYPFVKAPLPRSRRVLGIYGAVAVGDISDVVHQAAKSTAGHLPVPDESSTSCCECESDTTLVSRCITGFDFNAEYLSRLCAVLRRSDGFLDVFYTREMELGDGSRSTSGSNFRYRRAVYPPRNNLLFADDIEYVCLIRHRCRLSVCAARNRFDTAAVVVVDGDRGVEMGEVDLIWHKTLFTTMNDDERVAQGWPSCGEVGALVYREATSAESEVYFTTLGDLADLTLAYLRLLSSRAYPFRTCRVEFMRFEACEFQADVQKLYVYYHTKKPVRFLELAAHLNHIFHCRIWMCEAGQCEH